MLRTPANPILPSSSSYLVLPCLHHTSPKPSLGRAAGPVPNSVATGGHRPELACWCLNKSVNPLQMLSLEHRKECGASKSTHRLQKCSASKSTHGLQAKPELLWKQEAGENRCVTRLNSASDAPKKKKKSIRSFLPSEVHGLGSTLLGAHGTNMHRKCLPWSTAGIWQQRQHSRLVTW